MNSNVVIGEGMNLEVEDLNISEGSTLEIKNGGSIAVNNNAEFTNSQVFINENGGLNVTNETNITNSMITIHDAENTSLNDLNLTTNTLFVINTGEELSVNSVTMQDANLRLGEDATLNVMNNLTVHHFLEVGINSNLNVGGDVNIISDSHFLARAGANISIDNNLEVQADAQISLISDNNNILPSASLIVDETITNAGIMKLELAIQAGLRKMYVSTPISEDFNTSNFTFAEGGKILKLENGRSTLANNEDMEVGRGYDIRDVLNLEESFRGTFNNNAEYELSTPPRKRRSALAGNPYPCAIDWDKNGWTKTNLRTSIYIWDEELGRLSSWNGNTGTNGRTNGFIPAMSGFIVKASKNSPVLKVSKTARFHEVNPPEQSKRANYISNLLRLKVTGKNYSDETVIILNDFISEAENTDKMFEDNEELPHLFTMSEDNFETSINNLFSEDENISIPLHFIAGEHGEFSMEITENNLNAKNVFIEDKNTGEIKNLENYKFNSKKSDSEDRFVLHFSNENLENIAEESVKIYSYEKSIYIDNPFENANVIVYDIAGRKVFEEFLNEKSLIKLDIAQKSGTYFVKFYSNNKIVNAKIIIK